MHPEVLVVDDDVKAAKTFADLVSSRTRICVHSTSTAAEALEIFEKYNIKVVVLDQKMPFVSGTSLFSKMKVLRTDFRAIMLTGEASTEEVGEALALGYSSYLHKSKVASLPGVVLNEVANYHANIALKESRDPPKLIFSQIRWGFFRKFNTLVWLESVSVLEEDFVPDESWLTILQIKAGQTLKFTDKITLESKIKIETHSEEKLAGSLSSSKIVPAISAKIEAHLNEKFGREISSSALAERTEEQSYSLPKEPDKFDANHVVSRSYQRAQTYKKLLVALRFDCDCCGRSERASVTVLKSTGKISTRHVDSLWRGDPRINMTGIHQF